MRSNTMNLRTLATTFTTAVVLALAGAGCDEMPAAGDEAVDAGDEQEPDGGFWGDEEPAEGDAVGGGEGPAGLASGNEAPVSEAVTLFRLMSKQTRSATDEELCFQPLEARAGAPVLQRACNNSPLSNNNPQAWFQTPTLGYRMQYALKDSATSQDLCLHAAGGVKALSDGVAMVLYQCDGVRPNQVIVASPPDADGAVALMPQHSHRCLTVFGGLDADLALLYQFGLYTGAASCGGVHQRWFLRTGGAGTYGWNNVAPEGWPAPMCVL